MQLNRELSALKLLNTLWIFVLNKRESRYSEILAATRPFTVWCEKQLQRSKYFAGVCQNQGMHDEKEAIIEQNKCRQFNVDLCTHQCEFKHWQENVIPCG